MSKDKEIKALKKRVRRLEKALDIPHYNIPNIILKRHYY